MLLSPFSTDLPVWRGTTPNHRTFSYITLLLKCANVRSQSLLSWWKFSLLSSFWLYHTNLHKSSFTQTKLVKIPQRLRREGKVWTDKFGKENLIWYLHGLVKVSNNPRSLTRSRITEAGVIGIADNPLNPRKCSCRGHGFVWKVTCWNWGEGKHKEKH